MSRTSAEWAAWAKENKVAYEISPLLELRGQERVQVGFGLTLYGALPPDDPPGTRREASHRLKEEMRAFLEEEITPGDSAARTEWQASGTEIVMRPANELRPEVGVTLRIFHADEYLKAVTAGEREGLSRFEKQLTAKGLRQGHW
jgi:hypothetical protein